MENRTTKVTVYGRPDCSLCDQAKQVLEEVRGRHPFRLEEVDISTDTQLEREYGDRIPLIWINGRLAFKYFVDRGQLVEKLGRP